MHIVVFKRLNIEHVTRYPVIPSFRLSLSKYLGKILGKGLNTLGAKTNILRYHMTDDKQNKTLREHEYNAIL